MATLVDYLNLQHDSSDANTILIKTVVNHFPDLLNIFGDNIDDSLIIKLVCATHDVTSTTDIVVINRMLSRKFILNALRLKIYALAIIVNNSSYTKNINNVVDQLTTITKTIDALQVYITNIRPSDNKSVTATQSYIVLFGTFGLIVFCISVIAAGTAKVDTGLGGAIISIASLLAGKIGTIIDYKWGGSIDSTKLNNTVMENMSNTKKGDVS